MWFTYLLLCKDGSIYTGATNDVQKRLQHHRNGKGGRYTRAHRAVKILYAEKFTTKKGALRREVHIKSWRRKKKLDLIKFGKSKRRL